MIKNKEKLKTRSTKIKKSLFEYKFVIDIILELKGNFLLRLHTKLRETR